jgi:hypothetical protein
VDTRKVGELPTTGDDVADRPLKGGHHGLRYARLVPVISLPFRASVGGINDAARTNDTASITRSCSPNSE